MLEKITNWVEVARTIFEQEAETILSASKRLNNDFSRAVELILAHQGKVIVSGVGKSGHVARKIAATLCSTGTPAVYIHPSEGAHGDLGIYQAGDPTVLLSKSGTSEELLRLVPVLKEFNSPIIAIIGNMESPLAKYADVVLDTSVYREADPNNLAPTSSTTLAMVMGDALALTLMQAKQFTSDDFHRYHPAGQLGRNLRLTVQDIMHRGNNVAWIYADASIKQVVIEMTQKPLGAACVIDDEHKLIGLITDGDLRRALLRHDDINLLLASDIMTVEPTTVSPNTKLKEALELMEHRTSQISVLPVIDEDTGRCSGLLRIHDIYSS